MLQRCGCFSDVTVGNCDFFVTSLIAVVSVILSIFSLLLTREKAVQFSRYVSLCAWVAVRRWLQLKGSMKEPNITIYFFFRPSLSGVLFPMFCLLVEGECQILVF